MGCLVDEEIMEIGRQFYLNNCRAKLIIHYYNLWGGVANAVIHLDSEIFGRELLSPRRITDDRVFMDGYTRVLDGYDDEKFERLLNKAKRYGWGFSYKTLRSEAWGFVGFKISTYDVEFKVKRILSMELVIDIESVELLRDKSFQELQKIVTPSLISTHKQLAHREDFLTPCQMLKSFNNL